MDIQDSSNGHEWLKRQVTLAGQTYLHLFCTICHRDLAKEITGRSWQAVYVGAVQFYFLDAQTTERWISERCPERQLAAEANHLRLSAINVNRAS